MKMINDMDLYYANEYKREQQPAWMKAERMDYCETDSTHRRGSEFVRGIFQRKER